MRIVKIIIIITIIVLFVIVFFWFLDREFIFRGLWSAGNGFEKKSKLINPVSLAEKIEEHGDVFLRFKENSAAFQVAVPRKFEAVSIATQFKSTGVPIIKLGVLAQKDPWQIKEKVIYNEYLDELDWTSMAGIDDYSGQLNDLKLWQRKPEFKSVDDFIKNPPAPEKVMVMNYNSLFPVKIANYTPSPGLNTYYINLRGAQTIWTYIQGESLNWHFYFQDVNRHDGRDNFLVKVENMAGQVIYEKEVEDDGDVWASGQLSDIREFILEEKISDGAYKIQITAPDDIFIRRIITGQSKFVFQYVLYLGDVSGYANPAPLTIFAKARELIFRTPHQEGKQRLRINGENFNIEEENQSYQFKTKYSLTRITVPFPDLKIDFDGFVSLTPDAFFMPKPLGFQNTGDLETFGIDYILAAGYNPIVIGDWVYNQVNLTLENVAQEQGLTIIFSLDKFQEDQILDISDLRIKLKRSPLDFKRLHGIIVSKFKNYLKRIL